MKAYKSPRQATLVLAPEVPAGDKTPAFLKKTDAVRRGCRYLCAAGEFDAKYELRTVDGPVATGASNDDIRAAVAWLRYEMGKGEEK